MEGKIFEMKSVLSSVVNKFLITQPNKIEKNK